MNKVSLFKHFNTFKIWTQTRIQQVQICIFSKDKESLKYKLLLWTFKIPVYVLWVFEVKLITCKMSLNIIPLLYRTFIRSELIWTVVKPFFFLIVTLIWKFNTQYVAKSEYLSSTISLHNYDWGCFLFIWPNKQHGNFLNNTETPKLMSPRFSLRSVSLEAELVL